MAEKVRYDERKLRELILYIARRSAADPYFGRTKLNKILFFADFEAYRRLRRPITGAVYQRLPQGPAVQQMLPILRTLEGSVTEISEDTFAGAQQRLVPLRSADLSVFTGEEIAIVDQVLDELRPMTNYQVSELSHTTMAWRLTENRQEIPYSFALVDSAPPTDEDVMWLAALSGSGAGEVRG